MATRTASIIVIGNDVLAGRRRDASGTQIAQWLERQGWELTSRCIVPTHENAISEAVRGALDSGVDLLVLAGGLGPSPAERGREGVAAALGLELEFDRAAFPAVEAWHRERGLEAPEGIERLVLRPVGAETAPNPIGPTPGFLFERGRTLLAALPAAPRELDEMLERLVAPRLNVRVGPVAARSAVVRVAGMTEGEIGERLAGLVDADPNVPLTISGEESEFVIRATARADAVEDAEERLAATLREIAVRLGDHIVGQGEETLVGALARELLERGWTLGVAEAITGGLVAKRVVDLPGAGDFFAGAVVPYGDRHKTTLLGVPEELLERCGPASAAAARAMAEGVRSRLHADVGVSTTGIAGPAGGGEDRPVGLVFIGVASPNGSAVRRHLFGGDRGAVRSMAASMALEQTRRFVIGSPLLGEADDDGDQPCGR